MTDREKVIDGLQEAVDWLSTETSLTVVDQWVVRDALALLKAQEPVEPTTKNGAYFCGNPHCRKIIAQMVPCGAPTHRVKYCSECGRAVKWQ